MGEVSGAPSDDMAELSISTKKLSKSCARKQRLSSRQPDQKQSLEKGPAGEGGPTPRKRCSCRAPAADPATSSSVVHPSSPWGRPGRGTHPPKAVLVSSNPLQRGPRAAARVPGAPRHLF